MLRITHRKLRALGPSTMKAQPRNDEFKWMSYNDAHKYEREAAAKGVSEVARSRRGFMRHYEKNKTPEKMKCAIVPGSKTQTWNARRSGFIKRHMAQYRQKKTVRRWLALIMWAFFPGKRPPR